MWVLPSVLLLLLFFFFDLLRGFLRRQVPARVGFRRRRRTWSWRWRGDSAVDAGGAFGLDPGFDVVLAVTHDPTTRTEPSDHAGDDAENSDDGEDRDDGSHRPVTQMGRVGLLGHF